MTRRAPLPARLWLLPLSMLCLFALTQLCPSVGMAVCNLGYLAMGLHFLRQQHQILRALVRAQRANRRSVQSAARDPLTGLPNRGRFVQVASHALARQPGKARLMAILLIDLDRFRTINEALGYAAGDKLLQAVAKRIEQRLGPDDAAARLAGDTFVVAMAGERSKSDVAAWVQLLLDSLCASYLLEDQALYISPCAGVSLCPRDGHDIDTLIRHAEAALRSAKQAGRAQYRFFAPSLCVPTAEAFALEQAFGGALAARQFVLHYQPQVCLRTSQVLGYEALVRWQHPTLGLLYPDRFIDMAEHSGHIVELGWEVLRLACEALTHGCLHDHGACLAVNVSAMQLYQADFSQRLLAQLEHYGLDPRRLELELTETVALAPQDSARAHLQRLRKTGLGISLDDFGSGYAGLVHLQALPLTKLKIDRALLAPLSRDDDQHPVLALTLLLARRLGLQVVAEGVETAAQVSWLQCAGCEMAQGYYFSMPLTPTQLPGYAPPRGIEERWQAGA